MEINVIKIIFISNVLLNKDIPKFRGYLSNKYPQYNLIHNHLENGKVRYSYPLIQFKTIEKHPALIGINNGVEILQKVFPSLTELKIANKKQIVFEKEISFKKIKFGISDNIINYNIISPWLTFNQKNYLVYKEILINSKNQIEKKQKVDVLLSKILIGNILSISKSLNYKVEEKIYLDFKLKKVFTKLKGVKMIGFKGTFRTNFLLPEYFGIGKSVSRGFGIIKQL